MEIPVRFVFLAFLADTNCVNFAQALPNASELERWRDHGVIHLERATPLPGEGGNAARAARRPRAKYPFSISGVEAADDWKLIERIGELLYPGGPRNANQEEHVESVFVAARTYRILVTRELGPPATPCRILGSAERLERELGVMVVTDAQAVELVRAAIRRRDDQAARISRECGIRLPDWVGRDE